MKDETKTIDLVVERGVNMGGTCKTLVIKDCYRNSDCKTTVESDTGKKQEGSK